MSLPLSPICLTADLFETTGLCPISATTTKSRHRPADLRVRTLTLTFGTVRAYSLTERDYGGEMVNGIRMILMTALCMGWAAHGLAGDQTGAVAYRDGKTVLEGYLALPAQSEGPLPGVLIVHQWMGLSDHEKEVADRLAEAGYAAFACDIYGKDDRPSDRSKAGAYAGKYKGNIALYRQRLRAGLKVLQEHPKIDPSRLAVIGYCFGGTGALELGRSGADVKAIVSLHGGLSTPNPEDARNIKGTVLICHGGDDRNVKDPELMAVLKELRDADVDWYLTIYGNSVHGFTHRHDPERYNAKAERRAWQAMMELFRETLRPASR